MNPDAQVTPSEDTNTRRVIGSFSKEKEGPHVVFLGGIHGNEPSGVTALEVVFKRLEELNLDFKGRITGLRGNLSALEAGKRFINKDLNRIWNTGFTHTNSLDSSIAEWHEKKQLMQEFDHIIDGKQTPVFIDLHTTSADGAPFMAIGDTVRNRKLTVGIPTPVILGFEEHMKGTLFNFFNFLGVCSMLFEGGQHESSTAIKSHEAFIWMILVNIGCIKKEDLPDCEEHYRWLLKASQGKSRIYETIYRYSVIDRELFNMDKGYENFQPVQKNDQIATYNDKRIRLKYEGKIFMPLYQDQGEDGFFIIREVNQFWINLSKKLRKLHLEKSLHILPGVYRHKELENTFIINPRIAFLFPRQFFHLFGYKKLFLGDSNLVMARRHYDIDPPENKEIREEFIKLTAIN